jgi:monofunctional biosynthetic peptidoglycan transglycosylase
MLIQSEFTTDHHTMQATASGSLWRKLYKLMWSTLLTFIVGSIISVMILRWLPVPTSSFMLYRHYEDVRDEQTFRPIRYDWVSYDNISHHAARAVIASEDQKFFHHAGFDLESIQKAINVYAKGGKLRGASTISQQVAKNLFLTPTKSLFRKGVEAWFTFLIETMWNKERILEVYLNIAEFGDHLFGIDEASHKYFGIPAKQLSPSQAALLAATLPNPIRFQANRPSGYVFKRQRWILRQMRNLGY